MIVINLIRRKSACVTARDEQAGPQRGPSRAESLHCEWRLY